MRQGSSDSVGTISEARRLEHFLYFLKFCFEHIKFAVNEFKKEPF